MHVHFQKWEKQILLFCKSAPFYGKIVLALLINLLIIQTAPVCLDKVPRQRLANAVTGNRDNDGGGVHPPDLFGVQAVRQVPETHVIIVSGRGTQNENLQDIRQK